MNKNKYVNLFLGILIGGMFFYSLFYWPDISALIQATIGIFGLIFAVWYNVEIMG
jgi:hypothetical protein